MKVLMVFAELLEDLLRALVFSLLLDQELLLNLILNVMCHQTNTTDNAVPNPLMDSVGVKRCIELLDHWKQLLLILSDRTFLLVVNAD